MRQVLRQGIDIVISGSCEFLIESIEIYTDVEYRCDAS